MPLMSVVVFLGPQRFHPTVVSVLDDLGVRGGIAAVTAGWQECEQEVDELAEHVERELTNLRLYERYEDVLSRDEQLAAALALRQRVFVEEQRVPVEEEIDTYDAHPEGGDDGGNASSALHV